MRRRIRLAVALTVLSALRLHAQYSGPVPPAAQAVFARAQDLAQKGSGAAARLLVDSVIAASSADSPVYPEALYWRAQFAAASADAERDFRHLIVDYPLSPRAGYALFSLGHFEMARGDRASAEMHLQRFIEENPTDSARARAGLDLAKLLLDDDQLSRGCAALLSAQGVVDSTAIELRNRIDFYVPRCRGVDTNTVMARNPPIVADTGRIAAPAVRPDSLKKDSIPRLPRDSSPGKDSGKTAPAPGSTQDSGKAPPNAGPATVHYTLQVAAYTEQSDAEQEALKLRNIGLDARVVGSAKPFRVRVGVYDTRAAAQAASVALKARQIATIVIDFTGEER